METKTVQIGEPVTAVACSPLSDLVGRAHCAARMAPPDRHDRQVALGTASGKVIVISSADGAVRNRIQAHRADVQSLAWQPTLGEDGAAPVLASGGKDEHVRGWRLEQGAASAPAFEIHAKPGMYKQ
jgi:hypothetical protein